MNNIKVLTGGLVLIVLTLAGGTGYLLYERIQSEVAPPSERATKQEVNEIRTEQEKQKKDVLELKDQVRINTVDIGANRKAIAANSAEIGILKESQKQLRKDMEAADEETRRQARELHELQQAKIDELAEQNKQIEERTSKLEKANEEIRKQLKAQGERIDEQEKRIGELEKKGDARDEEIAQLKRDLADLRKQLGLEKEPSN